MACAIPSNFLLIEAQYKKHGSTLRRIKVKVYESFSVVPVISFYSLVIWNEYLFQELIERRRRKMKDFQGYRQKKNNEYAQQKPQRLELRNGKKIKGSSGWLETTLHAFA